MRVVAEALAMVLVNAVVASATMARRVIRRAGAKANNGRRRVAPATVVAMGVEMGQATLHRPGLPRVNPTRCAPVST